MPTTEERLLHVTLKLKRAKKHAADLERAISTFLGTNPYRVSTRRDPQSRKLIYYVASVEPTPHDLALIAGDVIQNQMTALDHLAYQLVCSDTGDQPPYPHRIYFPIADDVTKYEATKRGKMQGARLETFDAIDTIKPYKGGNDLLWSLLRLNNIEKHRLLFTVGSMFQSFNLGAYISADLAKSLAEESPGQTFPVLDLFIKPADKLCPLKAGDELFIDGPDTKVNEKMQFRFNVALSEPQVIQAQSLLETVHQFTKLVEDIVAALSHRFR